MDAGGPSDDTKVVLMLLAVIGLIAIGSVLILGLAAMSAPYVLDW